MNVCGSAVPRIRRSHAMVAEPKLHPCTVSLSPVLGSSRSMGPGHCPRILKGSCEEFCPETKISGLTASCQRALKSMCSPWFYFSSIVKYISLDQTEGNGKTLLTSEYFCHAEQWNRVQSKTNKLKGHLVKGFLTYPASKVSCSLHFQILILDSELGNIRG